MKIRLYTRKQSEVNPKYKEWELEVNSIPRKNEIVIIDDMFYKVKEVAHNIRENKVNTISICITRDH